MSRALFLLAAAGLSCATGQSQIPGPGGPAASGPTTAAAAPVRTWPQPKPVVLRHATVMPASGPAIEDGAISFAEGKIVAVGRNGEVATPPGAEEVDLKGRFVTPGIIDVHSHLGVYSSPDSWAAMEGNEATAPVTAEVSAEHGFWPQDPGLRRAAAGGITSLLVLPGSANLIGGRGIPIKLHFGRSAREMRFPGAPDVLKMACGENPRRTYGRERKVNPSTRMGNAAGYRQAFSKARDYRNKWEHWRQKNRRDPKDAGPPPERDLQLETLAEVLEGKILVQNHCYRADEMAVMLGIAEEFGYQIRAFHHALEAYKVRDLLAARKVGIATWADWWGFKLEAWDGIPENAALLSAAGGRPTIHSDSEIGIQRLNQETGKALARARESGIPVAEEEALRWITLNAAWVMGVEEKTGSLQPGKMADIAIWDRHPFSAFARAQRVYADGVITYDIEKGPALPSDYEVGAGVDGAHTLTARPATLPGALPRCEPAKAPCAKPIPLPEGKTPGCTVIEGAEVLGAKEPLRGSVTIRDGKIEAVAAKPGKTAGCRMVDGKGKVLAPGFIDPYTTLGLVEIIQEETSNDVGPRGDAAKDPIRAALRAADSFNPGSVLLPVARQGGVTSAFALPGGGLVAGQSAWIATGGAIRRSPLALHVNLGIPGQGAIQSTKGAALERLRELLDDAREYARRKGDFDQNRMRQLSASRLDLEAVQAVLAGRIPMMVAAERVADIRAVLALARDYRIKVAIAGGGDAWRIAPELARAKVPVIVQPTANLPGFDRPGSRADNAALLHAAGVKVLISSLGDPHRVRILGQEAGNAVAWGLPHAEAIRAISANVAEAFGLDAGRVAPGAQADLVLWSGDPLDVGSQALAMWIGGEQVSLESRHNALFRKYAGANGGPQQRP
jgi:imidazolonepropionase-like amidohydrolase